MQRSLQLTSMFHNICFCIATPMAEIVMAEIRMTEATSVVQTTERALLVTNSQIGVISLP